MNCVANPGPQPARFLFYFDLNDLMFFRAFNADLRCDREKIMSCITTKATASSSVCGETDYSKVFSGDTTVAACCQVGYCLRSAMQLAMQLVGGAISILTKEVVFA